jgi:F420H(2)-dependent quinone reductase
MGYLDLADRSWPVLNRVFGAHKAIYRASGGRIGRRIPFVGAPMLLLDHTGAKSGITRTAPLLYVEDGDNVAIIASKGGYPKNPAWYYNLKAHPETTVQIGRERRAVRARQAEGEERERLWQKAAAAWQGYRDYAARTDRKIPVIVLERL